MKSGYKTTGGPEGPAYSCACKANLVRALVRWRVGGHQLLGSQIYLPVLSMYPNLIPTRTLATPLTNPLVKSDGIENTVLPCLSIKPVFGVASSSAERVAE